jgi:RimJ/RimL family protein N-acetyltransferase
MNNISAGRLELIPLSRSQLEICLVDLSSLEQQLGLMIARDFFTERVQRAISMKIEKMRETDESRHVWLTYWLIVVKETNIGAGMLGFKGYPNAEGSTEIGYGIDPAYQGKGYMSEAVQALIEWAFTHPFVSSQKEGETSRRFLQKTWLNRSNLRDGVSIEWAFTHPFCTKITATDVENPASNRLLERLGAIRVGGNEESTSWEIRKALA